MKLVRASRSKLEDHYGIVTLSDYASAEVEGTKEELVAFEAFMTSRGWQELICESTEVSTRKNGTVVYCDTYDFDSTEIAEFKEDYKLYRA